MTLTSTETKKAVIGVSSAAYIEKKGNEKTPYNK